MKQGLSGTPVQHPAQAFGRIAQALAARKMFGQMGQENAARNAALFGSIGALAGPPGTGGLDPDALLSLAGEPGGGALAAQERGLTRQEEQASEQSRGNVQSLLALAQHDPKAARSVMVRLLADRFKPQQPRVFQDVAGRRRYETGEFLFPGAKPRLKAPKTRRRIAGGQAVQEEFNAATGTWRPIGRGERFKPSGLRENAEWYAKVTGTPVAEAAKLFAQSKASGPEAFWQKVYLASLRNFSSPEEAKKIANTSVELAFQSGKPGAAPPSPEVAAAPAGTFLERNVPFVGGALQEGLDFLSRETQDLLGGPQEPQGQLPAGLTPQPKPAVPSGGVPEAQFSSQLERAKRGEVLTIEELRAMTPEQRKRLRAALQ